VGAQRLKGARSASRGAHSAPAGRHEPAGKERGEHRRIHYRTIWMTRPAGRREGDRPAQPSFSLVIEELRTAAEVETCIRDCTSAALASSAWQRIRMYLSALAARGRPTKSSCGGRGSRRAAQGDAAYRGEPRMVRTAAACRDEPGDGPAGQDRGGAEDRHLHR